MPKQKVSLKYILKQSLKVFRSKGYHHTSMEDLARACGLQKGSLYHYFNGKEALMKAVIEYMHDYFKREAFSHAFDDNLGLKQRLQLLADIAETQYFASESGCLFGNLALGSAGTIPELSVLVKQFFIDWMDALEYIFKEKYGEEKAREIASDAVAEIEGAVMMMRIYNDRSFLERAHARIISRLD